MITGGGHPLRFLWEEQNGTLSTVLHPDMNAEVVTYDYMNARESPCSSNISAGDTS